MLQVMGGGLASLLQQSVWVMTTTAAAASATGVFVGSALVFQPLLLLLPAACSVVGKWQWASGFSSCSIVCSALALARGPRPRTSFRLPCVTALLIAGL